jgi:hypothetical protein
VKRWLVNRLLGISHSAERDLVSREWVIYPDQTKFSVEQVLTGQSLRLDSDKREKLKPKWSREHS